MDTKPSGRFSNLYFPGVISIIALPFVCFIYLYYHVSKYSITVTWFDKRRVEILNSDLSQNIDFQKFRVYSNLYLTGNNDIKTLKRLASMEDDLVNENDVKNGICINLTKHTTFQDLVSVLDMGANHPSLNILPYNDQIFVFKYDKSATNLDYYSNSKYKAMHPINNPNDNIIPDDQGETFTTKLQKGINKVIPFWPSLIPLLGMVFFWKRRDNLIATKS